MPLPTINQSSATDQSVDYTSLISEIQSTIDKNDSLFKQIQQTNYPNAGSYSSDLLNYKISTQVADLTKTRIQIWDFLNKKYNENTNLRAYYFDEIRKADNHISDLTKKKNDMIDSVQSKKIMTSTADESIKQEKFYFNKMEYYLFLYKVLVLVQIIILAVIMLCILGILPRTACLVITLIILTAALAFVGYYVFMVNIGRSMFSWTKFEHDNSSVKNKQCISPPNVVSTADKGKLLADKEIDSIIKKSKNNGASCSAQPTTSM
jgi:hypothetical protein